MQFRSGETALARAEDRGVVGVDAGFLPPPFFRLAPNSSGGEKHNYGSYSVLVLLQLVWGRVGGTGFLDELIPHIS